MSSPATRAICFCARSRQDSSSRSSAERLRSCCWAFGWCGRARKTRRARSVMWSSYGVFAALGLVHYALIATRFDKPWVKYVFISLDIAIVSALVATQPLYESAAELPSVMMFRTAVFPFYFVILGVAAFSFSPGMVLWTGIAGALGWLAAFLHSVSHVERSPQLERYPGKAHRRAGLGGRARPELRRLQQSPPGGGLARDRRVPDRSRNVASAQHAQAAIASGTGPHHPLRHLRALRSASDRERHNRRARSACAC